MQSRLTPLLRRYQYGTDNTSPLNKLNIECTSCPICNWKFQNNSRTHSCARNHSFSIYNTDLKVLNELGFWGIHKICPQNLGSLTSSPLYILDGHLYYEIHSTYLTMLFHDPPQTPDPFIHHTHSWSEAPYLPDGTGI